MLEEEKSGNCGEKSGNGGNCGGKSGNAGGEGKWEMVGGFLLGRAGKGRWGRNYYNIYSNCQHYVYVDLLGISGV